MSPSDKMRPAEEAKHTPTPWIFTLSGMRMRDDYSQPVAIAQHGFGNLIAGVFGDVRGGEPVAKANAADIVRAVNAHDDLIAAVQFVLDHIADPERTPRDLYSAFGLDSSRAITMCRAAIAKARGGVAS